MATSTEVLNLVLLGRTGVGKSSCGNTILGREVFKSKRSSRSVTRDVAVESAPVGHIPVTVYVYDTPGLFDTDMSEKEIDLKYQSILEKCESGPSAFLLVIKADRFTEEERRTVEKIENMLGEKRLEKTWILFTRGDELEEENLTIQEFISETEPLKKLIQKYDHRYHVFNNKRRGHKQVQMLLLKICKPYMVEGPEIMKQDPLMRKTLDFKPVSTLSSRRIVLLGKTGVGKSAAGNTILGQKEFRCERRMNAVTRVCSEAHTTVSGRSVFVVDTPGFLDTQMSPEELMTEIARSVYLSSPGPHAFLIVFSLVMRFTEHEQQIPQMIEMMFGEEVLKYSIVLFTHGDLLEGEFAELIWGNSRLRHLLDQCGGRYQVFNNRAENYSEQVNDLLQKIDSMIEQNRGGYYSHQMFEDTQRFRRVKEERRRSEEQERRLIEEERMLEQRRQELERVMVEERLGAEKKYALERLETERHEKETFFTRIKRHCIVAGAVVGATAGVVVAAPLAVVALPVTAAAAAVAGAVGVAGGALVGAAGGEVVAETLVEKIKKSSRN